MRRTFKGTWREDHETIDDDHGDWTELSDWFKDPSDGCRTFSSSGVTMIKLYCKAKLHCYTCGREETVDVEIKPMLRVGAEMDLLSEDPKGWSVYDGDASCSDRRECYKRAGFE